MANPNPLSTKTPNWFWYAFIPVVGSGVIIYAGRKSHTPEWFYLGLGLFTASLVLAATDLLIVVWLIQIAVAFSLRQKFALKTLPSNTYLSITDRKTAGLLAETRGKVDINRCSKDEMVRLLGLPIVYANNIELVRNEGYIFTSLEELSELAELPESYLHNLEPLIMFTYDFKREANFSWRRLNSYSQDELVGLGVSPTLAERIVQGRQTGSYKSLVDVQRRTGIPIRELQCVI